VTINITSGATTTLQTVEITWPSANGMLKKINSQNVDAPPPSATVGVSIPIGSSTDIVFMFEDPAADPGYTIIFTFSGGCTKTFNR
jgi:hypothetical protein